MVAVLPEAVGLYKAASMASIASASLVWALIVVFGWPGMLRRVKMPRPDR